ncbi:DNA polymerase III subunit delta' [Candidatus Portiera aleyrodidarum]|uniref:DNA-directed DNA polymerase n=1 Tax=Candidatus Portiera aleyrodidarum TV TaxID=1297582 RepID=A0A8D3X765_9GAMM|nr:DNA polymerase III, delta' subunit [Candidatus Portiera aleyrodidarum]AGI27037.1 DNA polymerase III, delta' subunit [Candidatus Portiera aleyrodidarum TV]CEI58996.1 DNA polymerase III subunit delta' [Candidatus Portiera aleyrodidarum]
MNKTKVLLPWHKNKLKKFLFLIKKEIIPHALLLIGQPGIGKNKFAKLLISIILCSNFNKKEDKINNYSCGSCNQCLMWINGYHPNIINISKYSIINIDSIRIINKFIETTPQYDGYRIIFIKNASNMTIEATNALLKNIEEPGSLVLFILTSNVLLLPTMNSRCCKFVFKPIYNNFFLFWVASHIYYSAESNLFLNITCNKPLLANNINYIINLRHILNIIFYNLINGAEPIKEIKKIKIKNINLFLDFGISFIEDIIRLLSGIKNIKNYDIISLYINLIKKNILLNNCFKLLYITYKKRKIFINNKNINNKLLLETWLINFIRNIFEEI